MIIQLHERLGLGRHQDVEGAGRKVGQQDRQQHGHRSDQGVDEELDGRVAAVLAAPNSDQEVHRNQGHFPEEIEQHIVQRHEHAQHAQFQQVEHHEVLPHPGADGAGAVVQAEGGQQGCEKNQGQTEAVDRNPEVRVQHRDPRRGNLAVQFAGIPVVGQHQPGTQDQWHEAEQDRRPADGPIRAAEHQYPNAGHQRHEEGCKQCHLARIGHWPDLLTLRNLETVATTPA